MHPKCVHGRQPTIILAQQSGSGKGGRGPWMDPSLISSHPSTSSAPSSRTRSAAAVRVNVTTSIRLESAPSSKRRATRRFIANVFPVPGPAITLSGVSSVAAMRRATPTNPSSQAITFLQSARLVTAEQKRRWTNDTTKIDFLSMSESSRAAWIRSRFSFKSGASGEIRTLKHLFLRQAAIPIRTRWHSGAQGRI